MSAVAVYYQVKAFGTYRHLCESCNALRIKNGWDSTKTKPYVDQACDDCSLRRKGEMK